MKNLGFVVNKDEGISLTENYFTVIEEKNSDSDWLLAINIEELLYKTNAILIVIDANTRPRKEKLAFSSIKKDKTYDNPDALTSSNVEAIQSSPAPEEGTPRRITDPDNKFPLVEPPALTLDSVTQYYEVAMAGSPFDNKTFLANIENVMLRLNKYKRDKDARPVYILMRGLTERPICQPFLPRILKLGKEIDATMVYFTTSAELPNLPKELINCNSMKVEPEPIACTNISQALQSRISHSYSNLSFENANQVLSELEKVMTDIFNIPGLSIESKQDIVNGIYAVYDHDKALLSCGAIGEDSSTEIHKTPRAWSKEM